MMPRDVNPQGTIFGGVLLSLIDQGAFVEALRQAPRRFVTVSFKQVEFHRPVLVGDVLSLWAESTRIGRTSITVRVRVLAQREGEPQDINVTEAEVTLVSVDDQGRPTPILE
ncbi:MAG: acyl-CoA thioesterase [Phycisphaeraceae bacterium]|nr:MAG: acyl-CoA thioesterase [Phycisphaeraceae bacterium]